MSQTVKEAEDRVRRYMTMKYQVDLDDLVISNVPGYWMDKEPKEHPGHPLHRCIGCEGPFCATYVYHDNQRDDVTGRFASPYRTWRILYEESLRNKEVASNEH